MKKLILLSLIIYMSSNSFGQTNKTQLLLGKTEKYVRTYLDSIVNENKDNGVYKEESKNKYGQVSMGVYSENEEEILDCLTIYCFFQKVENDQICIKQLIGGNPEYAEKQIAALNESYKKIATNKWTKPFKMGFSVFAEYVLDKTDETYYITFELIDEGSKN